MSPEPSYTYICILDYEVLFIFTPIPLNRLILIFMEGVFYLASFPRKIKFDPAIPLGIVGSFFQEGVRGNVSSPYIVYLMVLSDPKENHYTDEIEVILEKIRLNSVVLYEEHQKRYLQLKSTLKYYKIPIIIISSISSIVSLSQQYLEQNIITLLNMTLGLVCSIIGSIELFFGISSQLIKENDTSKEYQILAMDIYKCLVLKRKDRPQNGATYLEHIYGTYVKLVENSNILRHAINDRLCDVPPVLPALLMNNGVVSSEPDTQEDEYPVPPLGNLRQITNMGNFDIESGGLSSRTRDSSQNELFIAGL
jgi:hypothetical protein